MAGQADKYRCARCGACTAVCPVYRQTGREAVSARGRMHLLSLFQEKDRSPLFRDIFSCCLLCGACEQACSRNLPLTAIFRQTRSEFSIFQGPHGLGKTMIRRLLGAPALLDLVVRAGISLRRLEALPPESGLRLRLGLLEEPPAETGAEKEDISTAASQIQWFAGCLARHLQPSVGRALLALLRNRGNDAAMIPDQRCCGLASFSAGRFDEARRLAWRNIRAFSGTSGIILTGCSSCAHHLRNYPSLFAGDSVRERAAREFAGRVREFSDWLTGKDINADPGGVRYRVAVHRACHQRFCGDGNATLVSLLAGLDRVELVEPEGGSRCCGLGGLFGAGYPELSWKIFKRCASSLLAGEPDIVLTECSGCLLQWQLGAARLDLSCRVMHPAVFLREYLGLTCG